MKKTFYILLLKRILFYSVIGLLFLPMIQQLHPFIALKPIGGAFVLAERPELGVSKWFDGQFQTDHQNYFEDNVGFRSIFIRLYNQVYFALFNQAKANGVVVGKENYLYEENYIKAYLGRDFIGREAIAEKVAKLEKVSDTLHTKNIDIMVVLAPGKGSFYPEFIPDKYSPGTVSVSNYDVYQAELSEKRIHTLDLNLWFRSLKSKSAYPLFPKTGIHWSKYGEALALDTLAEYIATMRGVALPSIEVTHVETPDTVRGTDDDIEKAMNLLFNIPDLKMAYPALRFGAAGEGITKPKVMTVADSYYWGLFGSGHTSWLFEGEQFWYYNQEIYAGSLPAPLKVEDVALIEEIEKKEVIILLFTDANLSQFAYGFIDQLHEAYFPAKPTL